jgi:hypothetical protein
MGILDALFNRGPGKADADEFPLDSEERANAARAVAGTSMSPEDVIVDYGDGNDDHSGNEHAKAWEHTDVDAPVFDRAEIYTFKEQPEPGEEHNEI